MDFNLIEKKWQKEWKKSNLYSFDKQDTKNKYYIMEMFSYPSGSRLHMGHWFNFGLTDSYARYKKMQGFNVFHPMGFDSFGLPTENYALKHNMHPIEATKQNMDIMLKQFEDMGASYDYDYTLATSTPEYYKWTQWLFIKLFNKGLAYQKFAPVNWCTSCKTVLANDQVIDGHCERCDSDVIKKQMTQWFFKTTAYAEQLLEGLNKIDWPEKTKTAQRNWIGKSLGAEVTFKTEAGEEIKTFTSRADTLYGVTWIVLAPEHPMVDKLTTTSQKEEIDKYKYQTSKKNDIERQSTKTEKTGAFTGSYVINPASGQKVPVYISDYVLASYGTGAVMGVAAHDTRDFDFAKKYNLPIVQVIINKEKNAELPFTEKGVLMASEEFNGLTSDKAITEIVKKLEKQNKGKFTTNYRLRDWSVSRQRYWGCPIPIVHCKQCGAVPVKEEALPVKLPRDVDYTPDGRSPLSKKEDYINTVCPKCGKPAKRDADTLDTFVCSSWYMLRYPNAKNSEMAIEPNFTNALMPVDKYVGGIEHATGHLLYSRFITKALKDMGYINFDEPFNSLVHQGMILNEEGTAKMSKRNGGVSPDDYIEKYGSDALRLYLMFGFNYIDGGPWDPNGIKPIIKFMERIERLVKNVLSIKSDYKEYGSAEKELDFAKNHAIKEVLKDFELFGFNTSVARMMELVNALYKYDKLENKNSKLFKQCITDLVKLIAPCAPHFAEELWEMLGNKTSIFKAGYPKHDESKLVKQEIEIVIQVNSKIVDKLVISTSASIKEMETLAKETAKVKEKLAGKTIIKAIAIPKRLVNFIVK